MGDLRRALEVLEERQLLRRLSEEEPSYLFKHALTQQMTYESLLAKARRDLHRRVAETIEQLYAERIEEFSGVLAEHYGEAENLSKTVDYASRAGDAAAQRYANREALGYYDRALEAARRVGISPAPLYRKRGAIHEVQGEFELAEKDLSRALSTAQRAGDRSLEWQVLIDLGYLWASRSYARSEKFFRAAHELAQALEEPRRIAQSLNRLGNWMGNTGQTLESLSLHREALDLYESGRDKQGIAETQDLLGVANLVYGDMGAAVQHYDQAIRLFQELRDVRGLISSLTTRSVCVSAAMCETIGAKVESEQEVSDALLRAAELSEQIGWQAGQAYAEWAQGLALVGFGRLGDGLLHGRRGFELASGIQHMQWMSGAAAAMATAYLEAWDAASAIEYSDQALELARKVYSDWLAVNFSTLRIRALIQQGALDKARQTLVERMTFDEPRNLGERRVQWVAGELALAEGDSDEALRIATALEANVPGGMQGLPIPRLRLLEGRALLAMDRLEEAELAFQSAKEAARQQQARPVLWQIHAQLARLYRHWGAERQANEELEQVLQLTDLLARGNPAWRACLKRAQGELMWKISPRKERLSK